MHLSRGDKDHSPTSTGLGDGLERAEVTVELLSMKAGVFIQTDNHGACSHFAGLRFFAMIYSVESGQSSPKSLGVDPRFRDRALFTDTPQPVGRLAGRQSAMLDHR